MLAIAKFIKNHNAMLVFGEFGTLGQKIHFKKFLIFISRSTQSIKHSHSYIVGTCSKTYFNGKTCGKTWRQHHWPWRGKDILIPTSLTMMMCRFMLLQTLCPTFNKPQGCQNIKEAQKAMKKTKCNGI